MTILMTVIIMTAKSVRLRLGLENLVNTFVLLIKTGFATVRIKWFSLYFVVYVRILCLTAVLSKFYNP